MSLAGFSGAVAAIAPRAARERVDVWSFALPTGRAAPPEDLRLLAADERARAARLRSGAAGWVAARAALRRVLGAHLGLEPERLRFTAGPNGKPALAPHAGEDLRFSLSHSGAVALVAVRIGHEVGVDVEELRDDVDFGAVVRETFPASERRSFAAGAGAVSREAFFRAWTRREALAKATGRGLVAAPGADEALRFAVRDLDGVPGCAAAIASAGGDWSVGRPRGAVATA